MSCSGQKKIEESNVEATLKQDIRIFLGQRGIDMYDANFEHTPERWMRYLESYTVKYNPEDDLKITFPPSDPLGDAYDRAMIVQTGIPYRAVCAHHLLPVLGTAHVGYIPNLRVVGLSKLTRLVYGITHATPSLQEDVTHQITACLMEHLEPQGAMCVISAEHGCMAARGVEEATGQIDTVTSSVKGVFAEKVEAREEFFHLIDQRRKS
jgi:GTP cyclohydrolase I